jgi:hypothetical protein
MSVVRLNRGAGIAQWYSAGIRAGRSGVRVPDVVGNFSLQHRVQAGSGAHPALYRMCISDSLEVKRTGREADHSPPSSAEVKNAWSYTSTPNTSSWSGDQLKKAQGQLHLYFLPLPCAFRSTNALYYVLQYTTVPLPTAFLVN